MSIGPTEWQVANGIALVLFAVTLTGWARLQPRVRSRVILGALAVTPVLAALLVLFQPAQVPVAWITVLMEGRSLRNVQQLYGEGAHFGPGFSWLIDALAGHRVTSLPAVVHFNLCLTVVNAILFLLIASYVLRSWWASILFALAYAGNLNTLHAACSETPATLWATHFWLGCVAAAVIDDRAHAAPGLRWVGLGCLAGLTVLAALLRQELLVIGAPAVAVGLARELGWEPAIREAVRSAGRILHGVVAGRLWVFLLAVAGLVAVDCLPFFGRASYVLPVFAPLNLSFVPMIQRLWVFLPLGLIVLFVLGMVHAVRWWLPFLALPFTLLTLLKIYSTASQGFFEQFRYLTFLTPVVFFVALFGFRELSDWAERRAWPWWWKRPVVVLLLLSVGVSQPFGPKESFGRRQQLPGVAPAAPLLGWNQQTEVRYLLDLVARHPTCVFVVKTVDAGWVRDPRSGYRWAVFGAAVPRFRDMPDHGESAEQVAQALAPGAPCMLFYRSLDCNLVGFDDCRSETQGRVALEEQVLENLPYSDIGSYGAHRAEIRLGVYPLRPGRG